MQAFVCIEQTYLGLPAAVVRLPASVVPSTLAASKGLLWYLSPRLPNAIDDDGYVTKQNLPLFLSWQQAILCRLPILPPNLPPMLPPRFKRGTQGHTSWLLLVLDFF
ncbi:hypothetical protein CORC01_02160 [Colletotrichum orchidophilum]|uniref:Uncharacterized protein n=1 Tax=Colletotrichum orchidophilum TaxID=1209926 RepID=A0A1G4BMB0_9PEZI|nr:uncharacterized protein CORC01_02160 [Colletotrichum orchidophilum]OHF02465.1 hypothetical protein CORC01_02160 [Colletotrichum orchidophilum]